VCVCVWVEGVWADEDVGGRACVRACMCMLVRTSEYVYKGVCVHVCV
jgi:hypothetical protein